MPKLVAGAAIALIAWIVAALVKIEVLEMHGSYNFGNFVPVALLVGFLCGWIILGSRVTGQLGFATSSSFGLTAVAATILWILFLVTASETLRLALSRRFNGPVQAIEAMVPIAANYGQHLLHIHIILTMVIGGLLAGWVADLAARRWK
ncbi:TrgA family protein [Pseudooceanicola sp. LIPI14-2-Ac024]|uniref:TrgA family protein n=1 Tax=Pseudooceanicola sp. LIPI14-2-Ac024 TaxID=3344875 RepID=UPI0035D06860